MKVSREQAAQNRERIVEAAAQLFRERGFAGIGVADLMKEAGLSLERIEELARRGIAWAAPNLLLGLLVILPVWFVVYLFRPPGHSRSE